VTQHDYIFLTKYFSTAIEARVRALASACTVEFIHAGCNIRVSEGSAADRELAKVIVTKKFIDRVKRDTADFVGISAKEAMDDGNLISLLTENKVCIQPTSRAASPLSTRPEVAVPQCQLTFVYMDGNTVGLARVKEYIKSICRVTATFTVRGFARSTFLSNPQNAIQERVGAASLVFHKFDVASESMAIDITGRVPTVNEALRVLEQLDLCEKNTQLLVCDANKEFHSFKAAVKETWNQMMTRVSAKLHHTT
jgi:hypothetical protein